MNSSQIIYVLRWLVRDTFQQAIAGKVFWVMLIVTGLCTLFCLGVSIEGGTERPEGDYIYTKSGAPLAGPNPAPGKLHLLFGAVTADFARDAFAQVQFLQVIFGSWVAGTTGLLLTLVWTAGFLPEFLHPASASVLLAKPVPRWLFLLGKYLGVVLFVGVQAALFFLLTWLALGLRTGYWPAGYLAGIPLLTLQFAILYSFSVLLAVCTRSTVACVLGVILFWGLCLGMNYGRHAAQTLPDLAPGTKLPQASLALIDAGYWFLPKPADMLIIVENALGAEKVQATVGSLSVFAKAQERGFFDPVMIVLSSVVFLLVMMALSAYQLASTDY